MRYIRGINESSLNVIESTVLDISSVFIDFIDDDNFIFSIGNIQWNNHISFYKVKKNIETFLRISNSDYVYIECNIKLKYNKLEADSLIELLDADSLIVLRDILIGIERLETLGHKCSLNLSGNHHQYKPCYVIVKIKNK